MAKKNTKIIYDEEEDILTLNKSRSVKASIDIGDFIIDVDNKGYVSGIEVLNASKNLNINKKYLKNLDKATLTANYKPKYVYLLLTLILKNKEKDIAIPLSVDLGHEKISTQKTSFAAT